MKIQLPIDTSAVVSAADAETDPQVSLAWTDEATTPVPEDLLGGDHGAGCRGHVGGHGVPTASPGTSARIPQRPRRWRAGGGL